MFVLFDLRISQWCLLNGNACFRSFFACLTPPAGRRRWYVPPKLPLRELHDRTPLRQMVFSVRHEKKSVCLLNFIIQSDTHDSIRQQFDVNISLLHTVAYRPAARQRPRNKRDNSLVRQRQARQCTRWKAVFSARSAPMAAHATINTATGERCFLCGPCIHVISRQILVYSTVVCSAGKWRVVSSELTRESRFCRSELVLSEASCCGTGIVRVPRVRGTYAVWSRYQATNGEDIAGWTRLTC
jgi:hypothetical protein